MENDNPLNLRGIEFTEFCGPASASLDGLFRAFGFSRLHRHAKRDIVHYCQNDIHFLLNGERGGFSAAFARAHGPSICSMGWRVDDARHAQSEAVRRGGRAPPAPASHQAYPRLDGRCGTPD